MTSEICFDILDDLSDELILDDYYRLMTINDLTNELVYKIVRRVEYYYDVFRWVTLHEVSCSKDDICACINIISVIEYACFVGDLEVLTWFFFNKRDQFCSNYITHAITGGHLNVVKWLHKVIKNKLNASDMIYASSNNFVDIAEWLRDNGWNRGDNGLSLVWASQHGHIEMVKWLVRNYGCDEIEGAFRSARIYNHVEIAEWILHNTDYKCTDEQLEWLRDNSIKIDE